MKIGPAGIALIQSYEKCRLKSYKPTPDDVWTCGWGSTEGVTEDTVWTQEEADEHFAKDLAWVEDCLNANIHVPITQNEFDACGSLTFNIGCKAFKDSTLCRLLNESKLEEAALQFGRWNKQAGNVLNGLTLRRASEQALFNAA